MARINIEDTWWNDPRRERLGEKLGNALLTDGVAIKLWRVSQTYWQKGQLIPGDVFIHFHGAREILESGLARIYPSPKIWLYPHPCERYPNAPERPPNEIEREVNECRTKLNSVREIYDLEHLWVYASGSREHHFWMVNGLLQRIEAGKKSAKARKAKNGSAQPNFTPRTDSNENTSRSDVLPNEPERAPNEPRTDSNEPEPSYSSSTSNSLNEEGSKNILGGPKINYPQSFENLWIHYERKGEKKKSLENWKKLKLDKLTEDGVQSLFKAIDHYKTAKPDREFRKDLERFLNMDWSVWVTPSVEMLQTTNRGNGKHPVTKAQAISQSNDDVFREYATDKGLGMGPSDGNLGN